MKEGFTMVFADSFPVRALSVNASIGGGLDMCSNTSILVFITFRI
jgi:hypothetical protein